MSDASRQTHWENVYTTRGEKDVSWFQEISAPSLELIALTRLSEDPAIIDIGGGASRLVDDLLARKFRRPTVLDLSRAALAATKERLGDRGAEVQWVIADVTKWQPMQMYDLWHDRAAFHFLTDHADQSAYVDRIKTAVKPGGHVIIGTFAPDGAERCSGLPIMRHDADTLAKILGSVRTDTRRHDHATPWRNSTIPVQHLSSHRRGLSSEKIAKCGTLLGRISGLAGLVSAVLSVAWAPDIEPFSRGLCDDVFRDSINTHLPALQSSRERNDADRCLPVFL
jgi:SAM-dependent methyltransferase